MSIRELRTTDRRTPRSRRPGYLVLAMALLAALLLQAGCSAAAPAAPSPAATTRPAPPTPAPLTKVKLGYGAAHGLLPITADRQGFFRQEGLDVTLVRFAAGKDVRDAIIARSLDAGPMAIDPFLVGAVKGDMVGISAAGHTGASSALVSAPAITRVEDLKGKKIGTQFGASAHTVLIGSILPSFGLKEGDYQLVNMKGDDLVAALTAGQIHAFSWAEPAISAAVVKGVGRRLITFEKWDPFVIVMSYARGFLSANPRAGTATVRALLKASDFFKQSPDKVAEIWAESEKQLAGTESDLAVVKESMRGFEPRVDFYPEFNSYVGAKLAELQKQNAITSAPPMEQLFDMKYLKEALQQR